MPDLFDTSQIRDDPEHWDRMAEQVAARATHAARLGPGSGVDWLARSHTGWVAASLLLAAALAFMVWPARKGTAANRGTEWADVLTPADDVGKAMTSWQRPPAIGALLLGDKDGI